VEYRRLADRIVRPQIGKLRVKELETADVSRLHQRLAGTPHQANRVLALFSKFANWAESNGYRPKFSNPAKGIEKFGEKGRERHLTPPEIQRLGKVLSESGEWPPAIAAIRLLIFHRGPAYRNKTATVDQVDLDRGIARMQVAEAKTGARNVQLPAAALKVLAELPQRPGNPHVIWGRR
jgi:hypothetical protein